MGVNYWAKIWIEMLDDRKVMTLPESLRWRFVECILLAKKHDRDGELPPVEDMAWMLRLNAESLSADMTRLAQAGLVELIMTNDGERWFLPKFEARQSQVVTHADRTQRWRDKKQRNETQARQSSDVVVTQRPPETETETETEGEKNARANTKPARPQPKAQPKPVSPPPFKNQFTDFPETAAERTEHAAMVKAVSEVTGMDAKLNFNKLAPSALELVRAGYQPDQVRAYYGRGAPAGQRNWYNDDWRGRKGDMPTPNNISETIGGAVQTAQPPQPEGGKLWLEHVKVFTGS